MKGGTLENGMRKNTDGEGRKNPPAFKSPRGSNGVTHFSHFAAHGKKVDSLERKAVR